MLGRVVEVLRCPVCGSGFVLDGALRCGRGHSFDVARQGYVNLQDSRTAAPSADTPAMVADRAGFLAEGHYAPLAARIAACAAPDAATDARPSAGSGAGPDPERDAGTGVGSQGASDRAPGAGLVVDAGAGTGYYLAAVLEAGPAAVGLAMDSSVAAVKRAARAHPRLGAIAWNVWQPWPLRPGCAEVVLNVFAPRNPAEFHRALAPGGRLVVVTPAPGHLAELRDLVRLLAVEPGKTGQLDESLSPAFRLADREELALPLELSPGQVRQVVGMSPNAHHAHGAGAADLPERVAVTASFVVSVFWPR